MHDSQQSWIDETLGALDGTRRASAPAGLHARVMARVGAARPKRVVLRAPMMWAAAAGFFLLVGVNAYALLHHRGGESLSRADVPRGDARPDGPRGGGNPLVEEYFAPTSIL